MIMVRAGKIVSEPRQTFALKDAASAHRALEGRGTTGTAMRENRVVIVNDYLNAGGFFKGANITTFATDNFTFDFVVWNVY